MTILSLIFGFCIQLKILIVYKMIKHGHKPVLANKKRTTRKFRTIVSEVSSFVGNPVYFDIFVVFVLYFCSGFTALVKEMYFI